MNTGQTATLVDADAAGREVVSTDQKTYRWIHTKKTRKTRSLQKAKKENLARAQRNWTGGIVPGLVKIFTLYG